ncbi:unnamed protein product [Arabidopsis halleri]
MEKEDTEYTYGAGSKRSNKFHSTPKPKAAPEKEILLKESDEDYPKDIPKGSPYYQKIWIDELREVINQGFRRTCWTIASTRSLSARLLIEGKADPPLLLSALHLLVGLFDKTDSKGGLQNLEHLQKFLKENGTLLEEDCKCVDPFAEDKKKDKRKSKKPKKAPILCTRKRQPKRMFKVRDLVISNTVDEKELIQLVNEGPVAVTIDVNEDFDKFKGDGIYTGPKKGAKKIDKHMLLINGYNTYKKQHYWNCQNSAGLSWGDNGFGKILRQVSRGDGQPSLFSGIVYPVLFDREAYNP